MKIGVSTSLFLDTDKTLSKALEILEEKVKYVELGCDGNLNIMLKENVEITQSYNLKYTLHCPISDLNLSSYRERIRKVSLDFIKDVLESATKVNAKLLVLHPGYCVFKYDYEKSLSSLIKSLKELNNIQEEFGVQITIENMPSYDMFMFRNPDKEIIENLDELKITFDIGHSFLNNNIQDFLKISDKIAHIHIHDNNGGFDEHLPIGKGKINFNNFNKDLKNINVIKMIELQNKSIGDLDLCINNLKNLLR
ncbi:sugar phosphate isomerase/epimerase family protein [Methanocaldococcus fervens]|uniref:Xylose isomerase domain protein TIM barrel n=1 Tax=Methanocaldococcus fervens (strain DSM 4213 / JCM 15782 / AG86) TaxID=573064 RepID=C7P5D3_METFA|nr:sugar phosphate isomerase/epimerase family protein [Methanocaldococcus fervens]ACV25311.1 Xylose isomerase domain protein TIM barrel [Methanocaldococcus fervens AG86]